MSLSALESFCLLIALPMCVYIHIHTCSVYLVCKWSESLQPSLSCFSSQSVCSAFLLSWFKIFPSLPGPESCPENSNQTVERERECLDQWNCQNWDSPGERNPKACIVSLEIVKQMMGQVLLFAKQTIRDIFCHQKIVETWSSIKILSRKKSDAKSSLIVGHP